MIAIFYSDVDKDLASSVLLKVIFKPHLLTVFPFPLPIQRLLLGSGCCCCVWLWLHCIDYPEMRVCLCVFLGEGGIGFMRLLMVLLIGLLL